MASLLNERGAGMDPITLIVTALAAGAALGLKDTASSAVRDAYAGLKALVTKRLAGRSAAGVVLSGHEKAPETWQAPLMAELSEAGADHDPGLVAAAQALMNLVDKAGARAGKYTVDARGAQGVQIGDHTRQDNVFHAPPGGLSYPKMTGSGVPGQRGTWLPTRLRQNPADVDPAMDNKGAGDGA
jgi:hypothetical protein